MIIICPDCKKEFYITKYHILVYQDALKTNSNLKFICKSCGDKVLDKYKK